MGFREVVSVHSRAENVLLYTYEARIACCTAKALRLHFKLLREFHYFIRIQKKHSSEHVPRSSFPLQWSQFRGTVPRYTRQPWATGLSIDSFHGNVCIKLSTVQ